MAVPTRDQMIGEDIGGRIRRAMPDDVVDRVEPRYRYLRRRADERRADRTFAERPSPPGEPSADAPRHVVCLVVDALRADAVDASTTPFLDSLGGVDAVSPSTWTVPAVSSILSGRYPHDHGAIRRSDDFEDSVRDVTPLPEPVDGGVPLLPDVLDGAGYDTYGAFGFVVPFLALRGRFRTHALYDDASAERLLADHANWLADRRDRRTFSYLHLADLHEPVDPPAGYWRSHDVDPEIPGIRGWRHEDVVESTPTVDRYRAHRRRLYEAAAEYVDNRLAAHRRRLSDLAGEENVAVVVAGDHGEGFWERAPFHAEHFADPRPAHCVGHGGAPYEVVTRVPLAVDGLPEPARGRPTSLVDVAPTVLDATVRGSRRRRGGGDIGDDGGDGGGRGVPLGESVPADRRLLVEGVRYGYEKKAVYADGWKLLVSKGDAVDVAFSLPEETVRTPPDEVESRLREALPEWPDGTAPERSVPADVERRLADLGYR